MNRELAEEFILKHVEAIEQVMRRYDKNFSYLSIAIVDGHISINNDYYHDGVKPINITKFRDGSVESFDY